MQPWAKIKDRVRLIARWVIAVLALLIVAVLAWTWLFDDAQRQDKLIRSAILGMAGFAIFLAWMILGSRWSPRVRWTVFALTVGCILFCRFALRIIGVTGDLIPIVEWRWHKRTKQVVAASAPNSSLQPATLSSNAPAAFSGSFPQFLGPNRNGILTGPALSRDWNTSPPRELWRRPVGPAWSGFAVEQGRAVTQEQRGSEELVSCYDTLTGEILWSHSDQSRYATTVAGEGPRATPTLFSNRVYSMGGAGMLNCLDLTTGKLLWQTNTLAAHQAKLPEWGVACSPLVTERAVFVTVGGRNSSMVAYDRQTGAVLWKAGNDDVHWSSPVRINFDGIPQVLIFSENVSSYDEQSGKLLWRHPWRSPYPHVTVPLVLASNRVLVSQGYGGGSELLQVSHQGSRWQAQQNWKSIRMKSKFGTLIYRDGFVYGLDDGALACIDAATGDLKWKGDRYGHGQMILVGELLLLMAESGEIVLMEPHPNEQRELARHKVFRAKTWNPPALAGDLLLVRNDREAACLRLPLNP